MVASLLLLTSRVCFAGDKIALVKTEKQLERVAVVGLYFSAQWCAPCRRTTPLLIKAYTSINGGVTNTRAAESSIRRFEIVFVSADTTDAAFAEYFNQMPWAAVPFTRKDIRDKLTTMFSVKGIPTLVLLDRKSGAVLNADALQTVLQDPNGRYTIQHHMNVGAFYPSGT